MKEIPWKASDTTNTEFDSTGDIQCPKCSALIGKYSWIGINCTCGEFIVPAFYLAKSDVQILKPN